MIQARLTKGYCIDTCALIDLWRRFYPPDIFKKLWKDIEGWGLEVVPLQKVLITNRPKALYIS